MGDDRRRATRLAAGRVLIGAFLALTVAYAAVALVSDGPDDWWVLALGVAGLVASVATYVTVRRGRGPRWMR